VSDSRFGLVVSTRISKKAVVRNRLRRQLSEIFRLKLKKILPGFDVMLLVKPGLAVLDFSQISAELINLLKKARLLL